jgi:hypothetical protein
VLLFQKRFHQGILDGTIRTTFRQWQKPRVKPGGRYRVHPVGVVVVDSISRMQVGDLTDDDARRAGFVDRSELIAYLRPMAKGALTSRTALYRIDLHHGGEGDFAQTAFEDQLSEDDVEEILRRLRRLDAGAPWTRNTLALIEERPRTAASKLAGSFGLETLQFKQRVRKLKRLGLTQSFEVGYEVSPRGRAFLARRKRW